MQKVCYPPAEGFGRVAMGELELQQRWEDGVEGGTVVHKQTGSWGVQMLQDEA